MTDEQKYAEQNKTLFEQQYESHYRNIYRFSFRLMGNEAEAQDITQETFLKLHRALGTILTQDNLKGWLYKTAANHCYNQLKRRKRYRSVLETLKDSTSPHLSTGCQFKEKPVEDHLVSQESRLLMRSVFDELPVRDRIVLQLYQDGLSYNEIADTIGVKRSSFRKILYRAVDKLAKRIKKGENR